VAYQDILLSYSLMPAMISVVKSFMTKFIESNIGYTSNTSKRRGSNRNSNKYRMLSLKLEGKAKDKATLLT
jgi:hypothetical protein